MRASATAVLGCLALINLPAGTSRACTSFCMDTPGGPVYGTNMDLFLGEGLVFVNRRGIAKMGYFENTNGETAAWISEYGSVTFNLVGRELAWGGMNEAGLVVSTMALDTSVLPEPDERPPLASGSWVQYVLDTCASIPEVIRVDSIVRLTSDACPYLVSDEHGNCATIEYLNGRMVCHTGEDLPIKALANATYAASLAFVDRGVLPQFNPGESVERVAAAAQEIESFGADPGVSAVDYSLGVLTETVVAPKKWWSNWFDEPYTRWSIVFDISGREIRFRTVTRPRVRRLSLRAFDFSCEAPVLMLDVNADLEGNVEQAFTPYDHDVNLKVFREFCDRWGANVSKEGAVELMRLFESFDCAESSPVMN